jgi:uncharacterized glyoxalase superfamily protein PhnB
LPINVQGVATLISVFNMPTAISFYRDILGFEITGISPMLSEDPDDVNWAMLQLGDGTVMLNTAYDPEDRPDGPEAERFAGHSDTCLYFGCPDVDGAFEYLSSKRLELQPPKVAPYGMKQLYVTDPDGYLVCFQCTA